MNVSIIAVLLLVLLHLNSASDPLPPQARPLVCSTEIVLFSPCLPYISLPPNNLSPTVPPHCCNALSSSATSPVICLCYLFRQPSMLGFPLNLTKLSGLPADCNVRDANLVTLNLKSLCSGSSPLPPLRSSAGSTVQNRANAGPSGAPSQSPHSKTESRNNSSLPEEGFHSITKVPPAAAQESAASSSAVKRLNLLIWCTIVFRNL